MKKTVLMLLITLVLLASCTNHNSLKEEPVLNVPQPEIKPIPKPSPEIEPTPVVVSKPIDYQPYGSTPLVKEIAEKLFNHETTVELDHYPDSDGDILYSATEAIKQNPMLLTEPTFYMPLEGKTLIFNYTKTQEELEVLRKEVWDKVTEIVSNIEYSTMSDYQKSEVAFDTIIDLISYDYKALEQVSSGQEGYEHMNDVYGGFILNLAVCGAYANSYVVLARAIGLEAVYIEGDYISRHAWVRTKLGDQWVNSDPTESDGAYTRYEYFNRKDEVFELSYKEDPFIVRQIYHADSDEYSYYAQHNLMKPEQEAKDYILQSIENQQEIIDVFVIDYDIDEILNWFMNLQLEHPEYTISYFTNDIIFMKK